MALHILIIFSAFQLPNVCLRDAYIRHVLGNELSKSGPLNFFFYKALV